MQDLLHSFSIWSVTVPAVTGLILLRRLDPDSKIILTITLLACLPQLTVPYLGLEKSYNNIFYNVYTLLEVALYALLFYRQINSVNNRRIHLLLIISYLVFLGTFYATPLTGRFFHEWVSAANLMYLLWVLLFLYEKYTSHHYMLSVKSAFFWYCIGLLIYAPTTFLMFSFYEKVSINKKASFSYLWSIHDIFNTMMYLLFTAGMIACFRFRKQNLNLYD